MVNLVEAHLDHNGFSGLVPDATQLVNLRVFDASYNDLCGVPKFPGGTVVDLTGYLQHYQNNNNITSHTVVQHVRRVNREGEWWWPAAEQSRVWLCELSKGAVGGLEKREVCEIGRHAARVPKSGATRRDEELSSGAASEQRRLRRPSAGKGRDGQLGSREEARRLAEKQGGGMLELRREEPTHQRFA
ncbi:hypothetical protein ACQ4PT_067397 [Festuca glaucescens]